MELEKFTEKAKNVLLTAQSLALKNNNQLLTPEHLLKALLTAEDNICTILVKNSSGNPNYALVEIDKELQTLPSVNGNGEHRIILSKEFDQLLEKSRILATDAGDVYITSEYLLAALLDLSSTPASRILKKCGVTSHSLQNAIKKLRKGRKADTATTEANNEALSRYTRDLTSIANDGHLDPVIGRDEEIRRTIQVISRRTKNNPVLIGNPGVGKTAIAEGLALRIVKGDVPETLKEKRLVSLDLAAMIAGTKFRGEFEERMKTLLQEISYLDGEIILFVDELHTLIGAGSSDGAMDASNMLKPALARGELHCIGATTFDEYRKHIEKDAALARRFQTIIVNEPNATESISILRGLKDKYELHHGVRITDAAIVAATNLSKRYIAERYLPDKAIDLIDEAASRRRMEIDSKPEQIDELDRKIVQLRIERQAMKKETDAASQDRLSILREELHALETSSSRLTDLWKTEKKTVWETQRTQEKLDEFRRELEISQRDSNYERAGELMYGIIPDLEKALNQVKSSSGNIIVKEEVTAEDIASVVSKWTGVPLTKLLQTEREKLLDTEKILEKRVIGQKEAINTVANAIRRSRTGLQHPDQPISSFLFLGPTGVGKTELTKALAEFLFDDEDAMVRIDMSEFMEKHSVARLIGAPPGYVGYDDGGALTEAVRRRPFQVVLYDEVEKAHPDVLNLLLQLLDDGRLSDSHGHTVDFRNSIIVMTSNIGAEFLAKQENHTPLHSEKEKVMLMVQKTFRPEFINRIDEILMFSRLSREDMTAIVDIQIASINTLLISRKIKIEVDNEATHWLADAGYDPIFGARPLKRVIQRSLQNPLANLILKEHISDGQVVPITVWNNILSISGNEKSTDLEKRPDAAE